MEPAIGRRLLSLSDMPLTHELSLQGPALVITAVAMVIVVIAVVAMCVCNQNSDAKLTTISPRKPTMDEIPNGNEVASNHVAVDIPIESPTDPLLNGSARTSHSPDGQQEVNKRESNHGNPGSAPRSSATLSRQLPDPPIAKETQGASLSDKTGGMNADQRNSRASNSSAAEANYDHLRQSKSPVKDDPGYDHVEGTLAGCQGDLATSARENVYCTPNGESDSGSGTTTVVNPPRRDHIYAVPNGESDSGSGIVGGRENDYTVPTGEEDPYSVISSKHTANNVYAHMDSDVDPYSRIDKVTPRLPPVAAPAFGEGEGEEFDPSYAHVRIGQPDSSAAAAANMSPLAMAPSSTLNVDDDDEDSTAFDDEMYAEVKKPKGGKQGGSPVAPAVPDRRYGEDEVETTSGGAFLVVMSEMSVGQPADPAAPVLTTGDQNGRSKRNGDGNYCDVTARESLARMHERQHLQGPTGGASGTASSGYMTARETPENYYDSVDGSSGDGAFSAQGPITLEQGDKRNSIASETYAEISPSGGSYQQVPLPPPVDRLKTVIQHQVDPARKSGGSSTGIDLTPEHNEEGYAIVSKKVGQRVVIKHSMSPSRSFDENLGTAVDPRRLGGAPSRTMENRRSAPLATVESDHDLSIDFPGYQTVKDAADIALELDIEPNYETVEESKKRAEKKNVQREKSENERRERTHRPHQYEEVTEVRNNGQESSNDVRKRVLQSHEYELISDVREQQKKHHNDHHKNPEQ